MLKSFPAQGRADILTREGGSDGSFWTVRLWSNPDLVIDDTTTLEDIVECNYSGYVPIVSSGWSAAAINVDRVAFRDSPIVVFAHNGGLVGQNVYGVYVTHDDLSGSSLVMVERFKVPKSMFSALNTVPTQVRISLRQSV